MVTGYAGSVRIVGVVLLAVTIVSGCASNQTLSGDPHDQFERINRTFYAFNDTLDRNVMQPVVNVYLKIPAGVRSSVHNFFDNAAYPGTAINQFLQGKFERGFEDVQRFIYNSTIGIGGLFDVSSGFGLTHHEEDFGQTLGVWGMQEGEYLTYPLLGPSSVRDTPGIVVSRFTDLMTYVAAWPVGILQTIDTRANLDNAIKIREESALDPYVYTREAYRQRREYLIYDGNPPIEEFEKGLDSTAQAKPR